MLVVEVARGRGSRRKVFLHRIKLKTLPEKAVGRALVCDC
jgi:hypothetical protein